MILFLKIGGGAINAAQIQSIAANEFGVEITVAGNKRESISDYDFAFTDSHACFPALLAWLDAGMPVPKSDQPIQVFDVVAWHADQTKSA